MKIHLVKKYRIRRTRSAPNFFFCNQNSNNIDYAYESETNAIEKATCLLCIRYFNLKLLE